MLKSRLTDLAIEASILLGLFVGSYILVIFVARSLFFGSLSNEFLGPVIFCVSTILGVIHIWSLLKKGKKIQATVFLTLIVLVIVYIFYFSWEAAQPGLL